MICFSSRFQRPLDWVIFTAGFTILPQVLRSFFNLCNQKWPDIKWSNLKNCYVYSNLKNFQWAEIGQALPVINHFTRFYNLVLMVKSRKKLQEIFKITEEENMYFMIFHSGPQITLQLAIWFQMDRCSILQDISLILHGFFIIISSSSLYLSQRYMCIISFSLE